MLNLQIETAVNLNGKHVKGHIINGELILTKLLQIENPISIQSKEELNELVLELQKVYSTMIQNEKLNQYETPRNKGMSTSTAQQPVISGQRPF